MYLLFIFNELYRNPAQSSYTSFVGCTEDKKNPERMLRACGSRDHSTTASSCVKPARECSFT